MKKARNIPTPPPINTIPLPANKTARMPSQPAVRMQQAEDQQMRKLAASVATPEVVAHQMAGYPQRRKKGATGVLSTFLLIAILGFSLYGMWMFLQR